MNAPTLNGRTALISGAAAGIGRATALALAADGAAVAVLDLNGAGAATVAAEIEQAGGTARAYTADVSDEAAIEAALAAIRRDLGDPGIVVCNAGIAGEPTVFAKESKAQWKRMFEVHVDGAFHLIRGTLNPMIDTGWGRIVCISSIAATVGWKGGASYAAAKAALLGLMRTLAIEVARKGITVNAVLPGVIETGLAREALEKVRDRIEASIPVGRVGQPEEIARAVAFLCSERSGYLTGQSLSPNGGMWIH